MKFLALRNKYVFTAISHLKYYRLLSLNDIDLEDTMLKRGGGGGTGCHNVSRSEVDLPTSDQFVTAI
jgi:hypothetical protein